MLPSFLLTARRHLGPGIESLAWILFASIRSSGAFAGLCILEVLQLCQPSSTTPRSPITSSWPSEENVEFNKVSSTRFMAPEGITTVMPRMPFLCWYLVLGRPSHNHQSVLSYHFSIVVNKQNPETFVFAIVSDWRLRGRQHDALPPRRRTSTPTPALETDEG